MVILKNKTCPKYNGFFKVHVSTPNILLGLYIDLSSVATFTKKLLHVIILGTSP